MPLTLEVTPYVEYKAGTKFGSVTPETYNLKSMVVKNEADQRYSTVILTRNGWF